MTRTDKKMILSFEVKTSKDRIIFLFILVIVSSCPFLRAFSRFSSTIKQKQTILDSSYFFHPIFTGYPYMM